jgi:hypothetical protein
MVLQADRTIRIPLFANSRRQPEVCSDIRCVDRRHANAALIQISEKLPGMPTPNANVLTFQPLPDKMRLKPLKVRIAGRWRRPLTLRVLQKTMNCRGVSASPFHQPAR